jgi:hypothetical protein
MKILRDRIGFMSIGVFSIYGQTLLNNTFIFFKSLFLQDGSLSQIPFFLWEEVEGCNSDESQWNRSRLLQL